MPLYLGLDASTQGLTAIVIEIDHDIRRVVFNRSLNFDRDLPEYGTTGGVRRTADGDLDASPVMWADALDRLLARLAAAADIAVEQIRAVAGAAHEQADVVLNQHIPDWQALDPSVGLAKQLKQAWGDGHRFDSMTGYFESLIAGADLRLARYWRMRYALPPAAAVPWTGDRAATAIGTGVIREGLAAVSLGTTDAVTTYSTQPPGTAQISLHNGSLAREWVRVEHHLDWDAVAALLEQSPGNDGCLMLPWLEREVTPPIAHAGPRRFGFDRHDAARNVRGLIEGQMMALANHAATISAVPIERIVVTGGAAANRAILQVMANVFGADVYRLDAVNAAALGAALRAYHADRLAAGEPVSWKTVVSGFTDPRPGHRVTPNPKYVAIYAELRQDYALLERIHKDRQPIC